MTERDLERIARNVSQGYMDGDYTSLDDALDDYNLFGYERRWCYGYTIGQIKVICYIYDNCADTLNGATREEILSCLGYTNENDINRFKRELKRYEEKRAVEPTEEELEPVYRLIGTNGDEKTGELLISQEEIKHALQLVITVENAAEILDITTEKACLICNTFPYVYDFAKMLEQLSRGFELKISNEEIDELNEYSYRTACEAVEEYKAIEAEKVNCMSRKENEKIQTQREIVRLCYGAGYKMDDLEGLGIFNIETLEKEWSDFVKEEEWKCIISDYRYEDILEEIRKHIGTRIAIAMGMDVESAAHYYNMSRPEHCWATITAFQADRAGLVIPFRYIVKELDGMLADICALSKKIRTGQLD